MNKPVSFSVYFCMEHGNELIDRFVGGGDGKAPAFVTITDFGFATEDPVLCEVDGCEKEAHTSFTIEYEAEAAPVPTGASKA